MLNWRHLTLAIAFAVISAGSSTDVARAGESGLFSPGFPPWPAPPNASSWCRREWQCGRHGCSWQGLCPPQTFATSYLWQVQDHWPAEALARVMPAFEAMGRSITHVGESGAGQIAKAANQIMVAAQMVAMGELLVFARKSGADPQKVVEAIRGGAAQCWTLDVKPPRLFAGNRSPGFKAYMQAKDLGIVMDTARQYGAPLPSAGVHTQLFAAMLEMGMRELDNSAVIGVLETLANTGLLDD